MFNKNNINFSYDNEKTICTINYDNYTAIGIAKCHPDDLDMQNKNTGCEIALHKAMIQLYYYQKRALKNKLSALNQLYYSMKHSKHFNPKSYENKMLQRQINLIKMDLDTIKELITTTKENLKEYIQLKDDFYIAIRKNRIKKAKNQ